MFSDPFTLALFCTACIICLTVMPFFLLAQRPGRCLKSFLLKMVCATMFVAAGALCLYAAKKNGFGGVYAKTMFTGLVLSWFGDLFLHIPGSHGKVFFGIGMLSFLAAHIFYIIAYTKASAFYFPDRMPFSWVEILCAAVLLLIVVYAGYKINVRPGKLTPAIILYSAALCTMFLKATSFAVSYLYINAKNAVLFCIILIVGAFLFVCSDATLAILMFCEKYKKHFPLKCFNIATYFVGQLLLASSILMITY